MNGDSDQDAKRTQLLGSKQQKYPVWIAPQRSLFIREIRCNQDRLWRRPQTQLSYGDRFDLWVAIDCYTLCKSHSNNPPVVLFRVPRRDVP